MCVQGVHTHTHVLFLQFALVSLFSTFTKSVARSSLTSSSPFSFTLLLRLWVERVNRTRTVSVLSNCSLPNRTRHSFRASRADQHAFLPACLMFFMGFAVQGRFFPVRTSLLFLSLSHSVVKRATFIPAVDGDGEGFCRTLCYLWSICARRRGDGKGGDGALCKILERENVNDFSLTVFGHQM